MAGLGSYTTDGNRPIVTALFGVELAGFWWTRKIFDNWGNRSQVRIFSYQLKNAIYGEP